MALFLGLCCFSPSLLFDVSVNTAPFCCPLSLFSSLPCLCMTIIRSRIEIVIIIAQFPHILPVQFQWPNNILAGSAHTDEHNGEPQNCYNEGLSFVPAPLLSPHGEHFRTVHSPEAGAQESRAPFTFCWHFHKWHLVPYSKK